MEMLIYGAASLVFLALFLVQLSLPAFVGYWIGKLTRVPGLKWVFLFLGVCLPILWAYVGYDTYKAMCPKVAAPQFFEKPTSKQRGYAVEWGEAKSFSIGSSFDPEAAFRAGSFQFVDVVGVARRCKPVPNDSKLARCAGLENEESHYVVRELAWKRLDKWWHPPIFQAEIRIEEKISGKLIAQANELIFGGGLLSTAMRMKGGDQDFSLRGCGYISQEIGLYRPTLSTRQQRMYAYQNVDQNFVERALTFVDPNE
jgi:hypothetical protein